MSYLGNAKTPLIYAPGTRDDLVPDPNTDKVTFTLSQEVPGGYEQNITVLRRKFLYNELCADNSAIELDVDTNSLIVSTDDILAAVLSSVVPGQNILISGSSDVDNNGLKQVSSVSYNPGGDSTTCTIIFEVTTPLSSDSTGEILTLTQAYDGPWEVLNGGSDYTIGGTGDDYNRLLTLSEVLQEEDFCYVLHHGDATYNFVPSQGSVGPDQLQENLRNFKLDRFVGDAVEDEFTLSQVVPSPRSVVVYVNGVVLEPTDDDYLTGEYSISSDGLTITFASPPAMSAKIRVLHLGFSTVSRRGVFSSGQIGVLGSDSVDSAQLRNGAVTEPKLSNLAVSTRTLQDDAVDGTKILLENDDALRAKKTDTTPADLLKLNTSDETELYSPNNLKIIINGSDLVVVSSSSLEPATDDAVSLGTPSKQWSEIHVNGDAVLGDTTVDSLACSGNISVTGTVDGVDVAALYTQVQAAIPPGVVWATAASSAPSGWLRCDGSVVSQITYSDLFAQIGTTYNTGGEGAGNFRLPDARGKFLLGKAASGTGSTLGATGGSLDHTHSVPAHTHSFAHTHGVPGHYHTHDTGAGSTLNITSSGTHNTDLAHTHSSTTTSASEGSHAHLVSVGPSTLTANSGGSHFHRMIYDGVATIINATTDHEGIYRSLNPAGGDTDYAYDLKTSGLPPTKGRTDTVASHSHTVSGSIAAETTSNHQHTITVPALSVGTFSSSTGAHTHATSAFSGSIGNVTGGQNGNNDLTTSSQSTSTTGSGGSGTSGTANPPFLVQNWIIKI